MATATTPSTSEIFANCFLTEDRSEQSADFEILMLSQIPVVDVDMLQDTTVAADERPTWSDWHSPSNPMMEMHAMVTMKSITQMTTKKTEEMLTEIMEMTTDMLTLEKIAQMVSWVKIQKVWLMANILPVIMLIVGFVKIPDVVQIIVQIISQMLKLQQIFLQIAVIIMLWKILRLMMEMTMHMKSQTAHMSRSEYNTTALGGLEMRLLDATLLISMGFPGLGDKNRFAVCVAKCWKSVSR